MSSPVDLSRVAAALPPIEAPRLAGEKPAGGGSFEQALTDAIGKVEQFRDEAHQSASRLLAGEGEELHQVALKTQEAELAFELFLQTRNKVVQAYQEVMRMQL